jgi:O-antigen ligase
MTSRWELGTGAHRAGDVSEKRNGLAWSILGLMMAVIFAGLPGMAGPSALLVVVIAMFTGLAHLAKPIKLGTPVGLLLSFTAWAVISALSTGVPVASMLKAVAFGALAFLTAVLVARAGADLSVRTMFIAVPGLLSAVAVACYVLVPEQALATTALGERRLKIPVIELHYVTLGVFAAIGLAGAIVLALIHVERRGAWFLVALLHFTVIILTNSRSPLIVAAISVAVAGLLYRASGRAFAAAVVIGTPIIVFASGPLMDRLTRQQSSEELLNLSGRLPIWRSALEGWEDQALLGTGYGYGMAQQLAAATSLDAVYELVTSDNTIIDNLVETGIPGAVLWVVFLLLSIRLVFDARRLFAEPTHRTPSVAIAAGVLAAMVAHALVSGGAAHYHPFLAVWVGAATVVWRACFVNSPPRKWHSRRSSHADSPQGSKGFGGT